MNRTYTPRPKLRDREPVAAIELMRLKCQEHRDGRLAALERVATLERTIQEIGDLAASSSTGPAQLESLKMIEELCGKYHYGHPSK